MALITSRCSGASSLCAPSTQSWCKHPLVGFCTPSVLTPYWMTRTFLFSSPPYADSPLYIGPFALIGIFKPSTFRQSPSSRNFPDQRLFLCRDLRPLYALCIGHDIDFWRCFWDQCRQRRSRYWRRGPCGLGLLKR